jgi:hypothetical protein
MSEHQTVKFESAAAGLRSRRHRQSISVQQHHHNHAPNHGANHGANHSANHGQLQKVGTPFVQVATGTQQVNLPPAQQYMLDPIVPSDHKHLHSTSDSVLPPSATSEPKNHKKTDPGMHFDIKSVAPATTHATDKTDLSSSNTRNNCKVTLGISASLTSTKPASQANTTSTPQFNNNNNPVETASRVITSGGITTKASHMYENLTKHAPKQDNLTVKMMSAETLDKAVNRPVGNKMRPNAAAARGKTAESSAKKFLPTEQPTDAHRSRKDGFNTKTLANKQVAFNNFVKTLGTSTPENVTGHLQPVKIHPASILKSYKEKIGTLQVKKIWQTSKPNYLPADVLSGSGENPNKIRINSNPDKIETQKSVKTPKSLEKPNKPVKFDEVEGVHRLNSMTLNKFFEHGIMMDDVDPPRPEAQLPVIPTVAIDVERQK